MLIHPDDTVPLPMDIRDETLPTANEKAKVAADTAAMLAEMGMPLEYSPKDEAAARQLLLNTQSTAIKAVVFNRGVATKLSALLNEYDKQIVRDAAQIRFYVTHRLLEVSDCGDIKYELKALELLGKITDVGLFTDRSEVIIHHKTSADLEQAIKDRIKKLLGSDIIDVTPTDVDLDEELGFSSDPAIAEGPLGTIDLNVALGLSDET